MRNQNCSRLIHDSRKSRGTEGSSMKKLSRPIVVTAWGAFVPTFENDQQLNENDKLKEILSREGLDTEAL